MRVRFATNASVLLCTASGTKILCDPWYSDGIYYGSWYNFPPLSPRQRTEFTDCRPDYIYISHLHPDHLDPVTLAEFDRDTPILIGKLPHPHLSRALRRLGFRVLKELPLDEPVPVDDLEICILGQFAGTSDGTPDDVDYALDTSLFVRDADGVRFFHSVDNPIKPADAARVAQRLGPIDLAILPYSGATFYPHAFPAWTVEQKQARTDALRQQKLDALVAVAREVRATYVIPAAGSYVMGGRIAGYSRYLHQATPAQLKCRWDAEPEPPGALLCLAPGDSVDIPSGKVTPHEEQPFRAFDEADRLAYASSLEGRRLPQDEIRVPEAFAIPWERLFEKARRNLWFNQQRLGVFPALDVEICINDSPGVPLLGTAPMFRFSLDRETVTQPAQTNPSARPWVRFTLDSSLLLMLLTGAAVWNNAQIGALVECEREPDVYNPTVHSLISFFVL